MQLSIDTKLVSSLYAARSNPHPQTNSIDLNCIPNRRTPKMNKVSFIVLLISCIVSVHCNTRYNYRPPPSYYPNYPQNYYPPQHYHGHYHQFHQPYYNRRPRQGEFYYDDGENIHVNRDQLVRGAAVFGAGLLKGVIISALINQSNSGITIG